MSIWMDSADDLCDLHSHSGSRVLLCLSGKHEGFEENIKYKFVDILFLVSKEIFAEWLQDKYERGLNNITSQLNSANMRLETYQKEHSSKADTLHNLRYKHDISRSLLEKLLLVWS